ncbi:MmcQ/YjbR family DNA-binding protein [Flaviaesturariibacter amylovorans]|uniref:MmcQ/YjbR family DNA-binding protein n=1 Tax=Flaviaesturariibacter amylovorans TaxID=1084520 RepID=A0ABP8GW10_9BACT
MELETLRQACLALPAVQEEVKWGADLVYTVGTKMFCVAGTDGPLTFSCKVPDDQFEELCRVPGIEPAPYLARARWVLLTEACSWKGSQQLELVRGSYRLVSAKLTKKVKGEIGIV